jgi:predicted dehydrogenase
MDELAGAAKAKGIPITVSYSRHWNPYVLRMQELVEAGLIGKVQSVVGYCGGTFLSFAAHTTDLICQFAGYCPTAVYAQGEVPPPKTAIPGGYEPEPALINMILEFKSGVRGVQIGTNGEQGGFYCNVYGTEGFARTGMYIPPYARDKDGKPIDLCKKGMPRNTSVFHIAYDQIAEHLDGGPLPACTGDAWTAVNELGFAGIESFHTQQRVTLPVPNRARKVFANG